MARKFGAVYQQLGLSYRRFLTALALMLGSSLLEMIGLSVLYPLVLVMGSGSSTTTWWGKLISHLGTQQTQIVCLFGAVVSLYAIKNIVLYFSYERNIKFAVYFQREMVSYLFRTHLRKPILDFQSNSSGYLAHILCVQPEKFIDGVLRPSLVLISELIVLAALSGFVFLLNPTLMLMILLVCGGTGAGYYLFFRRRAHQWGSRLMEAAAGQQELVNNTATGISEIKVFGKEAFLERRLAALVGEKTKLFHHLEMFQTAPRYLAESVFIVTVMSFFSWRLLNGQQPAALLAQFSVVAAASFRILPSINRIVGSYSNFSFNLGPAFVLLDMILSARDVVTTELAVDSPNVGFRHKPISLRGVSFRYPHNERHVLDHISLEFPAGCRIGLSGESGSGKSTLIKLLAGLYSPTSGNIFVGGVDITKNTRRWQQNLGYVPQESFVMPGTIFENVTFSDDGQSASEEQVFEVLKTVGLYDMVSQLPNRLETRIGEKGVSLSGGQRQLLCLARALFREPCVLLLDEPTASLDLENEAVVMRAISCLPRDTFIVMASHRKENFRGFDLVYDFESGRMNSYQKANKLISPTSLGNEISLDL